MKILIVDDTPLILMAEQTMLASMGCNISIASNAQDALGCMDDTIDVVLTDMQMPEVNGDVLAKRIHQKFPDVLIIGITTLIKKNNRVLDGDFDLSDFVDLFPKPLNRKLCQTIIKMAAAKNAAHISGESRKKQPAHVFSCAGSF
tara:strand:- start:67314 stop:67748 length:435 start_codon:yes stop_codon:yes gene_type:complete